MVRNQAQQNFKVVLLVVQAVVHHILVLPVQELQVKVLRAEQAGQVQLVAELHGLLVVAEVLRL